MDGATGLQNFPTNISWRTGRGNRKLLVISTDGSFHLAGDGKLVGVVLPHDGNCYVDSNGMYTYATILDYPSLSLIRQKIQRNDVFVIFAVTKEQESNYVQLSQQLHPFAVTQGIDNDNNSITAVIENEYRKLVNTVTLLSDFKHKEFIGVKFFAKCPNEADFTESNQCNEVGPGVSVSFNVEVELKDCPSNRDSWNSNLTIYPQSSSEDSMTIQFSMLCGCDCEAMSLMESFDKSNKSLECSNHGFLQCGICECDSKWGGPYCNCTAGEGSSMNKTECIDPKTGDVCNNRGKCDSCGLCKCNAVNGNPRAYDGKYCECDNTNCVFEPSGDKGLCNSQWSDGPHGVCECGQCKCRNDYSGSRCECPTSQEMCRDPESPHKICNGIGLCKCGKCSCGATNTGEFCEIQHAKINGSCEAARSETINCVKCLVLANSENRNDEMREKRCRDECPNIKIIFREMTDRIGVEEEENVCVGTEEDAEGCRVDYIIREKNIQTNKISLQIEPGEIVVRDKCPPPAPLFQIILGMIVGIIIIGVLLLLLWKTITHIQDRREYERFEKAINDASWNANENPLYKSTTSRFRNPMYINYQEEEDEEEEEEEDTELS